MTKIVTARMKDSHSVDKNDERHRILRSKLDCTFLKATRRENDRFLVS